MRHLVWIIGTGLLLASCNGSDKEYDASGVFEATETVVSAQGAGELLRFDIEEGMELKAGAELGCIDTIQLHLQKQQLSGSLKSAASRRYDVERQIASIRQQIATQRREQQRFAALVRDNAANWKQLDDIEAQIALLEKQLAAKQETLANTNSGAEGDIQSIEAQIKLLDDRIRKCVITSPVDGTVLAKYAERGELASQGKPLFKVAEISRMYLRVYVTADLLTRLKIGQTVRVFADEGESGRREYAGKVTWISDKAEFTPKTIQTRDERANLVYAVKVAVKNDGLIKCGMYGEIKTDGKP